ncbi:Di-tripeptide/cation symporter [hydrothermal vent metagenome]|uniref:Di-tripeptide/cation symporter n=1 Tax=hydrothermal vent metagenome TaxID=652676 RepID=A0A3B0RRA8_9ZZZZ
MANSDASVVASPTGEETFLGHPRGLVILFFTEMWERFSYYGMRGLLIIYLTQHFLFSDERSALIYGAYVSLVYVMAIFGGSLADKYLGQRKAVTFGAILLVIGHFGMAFEGSGSKQIMTYQGAEYQLTLDGRGGDATQLVLSDQGRSEISFNDDASQMIVADPAAVGLPATLPTNAYETRTEREGFYLGILYLSLGLIIAGVGFLKANISTIVGDLYTQGDARRDGGFTLFYMGINLGAFLASWTCGILGIVYGWKYGFGLAGIGMAFGLFIFLRYQHWLKGLAEPPNPEKLKQKVFGPINVEWACYSSALLIIAVAMALIMNPEPASMLMAAVGVLMFIFLIGYSIIKLVGKERSRMWAAVYFALAQIPFWSLFEQAGSSLNLFTDRLVDRNLLGWSVPAPVFQSLNAMFIVIFAPLIAMLWVWMSKKKIEPSTPVKFSIGVFGVALGFLALVAGMKTTGASALTPVMFIFLIYWIHTMAELMLSPVGLSAMTKLAPVQAGGLIMGTWFLYTGLSNSLAGVIASSTGAETIGGKIIDATSAKAGYAAVYTNVAYVALGIAVVMLLISPIIKKWMHEADS